MIVATFVIKLPIVANVINLLIGLLNLSQKRKVDMMNRQHTTDIPELTRSIRSRFLRVLPVTSLGRTIVASFDRNASIGGPLSVEVLSLDIPFGEAYGGSVGYNFPKRSCRSIVLVRSKINKSLFSKACQCRILIYPMTV